MDWKHLATVAVVLSVQILVTSAQAVSENPECRICPCMTVPRSDGSCPICICNGVALPDCPELPDFCPRNCILQRDDEGCNQCACMRENPVVCPPLPPCPEECQQLIDEDGCPRCICDAPPRNCPAITCPESCTEELGSDGCISCRCQRTDICPALRPCLRGCIENDAESGCFSCNCTLLTELPRDTEDPVISPDNSMPGIGPFGFRPSDIGPVGSRPSDIGEVDSGPLDISPVGSRTSGIGPFIRNGFNQPSNRCRNERLFCPSDCRIVLGDHGCRLCICGEDAYLCPGVPRCSNRCLFLSPEDKCCRCDCRGPQPSNGILTITLIRVPPFRIGRPFGRPFRPPRPFGPETDFDDLPFLPPFFPRDPENNCTVDPASCNPTCRVIEDSDGCPVCDCPGDLCPRIRCPPRCVREIGPNGCPVCNCGGGISPVDPDAESINPFDPPMSANPDAGSMNPFGPPMSVPPQDPNGSGIPLLPIDPVGPVNSDPPTMASEPFNPDLPVNPSEPANPDSPMMASEPFNPDLPVIPSEAVDPNTQTISANPTNPVPPPATVDPTPVIPAEPVNPAPASPVVPADSVNSMSPMVPNIPLDNPQTSSAPVNPSSNPLGQSPSVSSSVPEIPQVLNNGDVPGVPLDPDDLKNPTVTSSDIFPVVQDVPDIPVSSESSNGGVSVDPEIPSTSFPSGMPLGAVNPQQTAPADPNSFFESTLRTGGSADASNNSQGNQNTQPEEDSASMNPSILNPDAQNIIPVNGNTEQENVDSGLTA